MAKYQCKQQYRDSYKGPARSLEAAGGVVLGIVAVKSPRCPTILRDLCAVCCIGAHSPPPPRAMNMTLCSRDFALHTSNENTDYKEF